MNPFILLLIPAYNALPLSTNVTRSASTSGYCEAAKDIVTGLMDYHQGDGTFIAAYWWQSGEAYTSLLNYQHICDDSQFEDDVYTGILSQVGSDYDFQPSSQNGQIGNDDIGSWALTAMLAAETGFKSGGHDWIDIVKNSYELLMDRWDNDTCHGGIRWQFDKARSGWDYKAHIANGNLFQLAGRLARYTGESSYVADATRIYNWISEVGLINELEYGTEVYDGVDTSRCGDVTKVLWTYNYGVLIGGSAYLYDATGEQTWKDRLSSILLGSQILYNDTILYERACELYDSCDLDQKVFKGVYLRYLGFATRLVPDVTDDVLALIAPSAKAAAKSCTGGSDGQTCGIDWSLGYWDGTWGPQQQLTALEVMLNQIAYKTTISKA